MKKCDVIEMVKWILSLVAGAAFLICFGGCYNSQKATKQTNKALIKFPAVVAKIARDAFPCIVVKSDTSYNYYDTTIMADCPAVPIIKDTVKIYFSLPSIPKIIQVPVKVEVPARTITIKIIDSAFNKICQLSKDSFSIQNAALQTKLTDAQATIKTKNKILLWLYIIIGLSITTFILKLIYKFR